MKNISLRFLTLLMITSLLLTSCSSYNAEAAQTETISEDQVIDVADEEMLAEAENSDSETEIQRPEGWSEDSHSNSADANYEVVFPQDEVNEITITIDAENWQTMMDDMTGLYGEFGIGSGRGNVPGAAPEGNIRPEGMEAAPQDNQQMRPQGNRGNGAAPQMGMENGLDQNPVWVDATIEFEDSIWTNVGIRFKGNSSLMQSWSSGNMKLPLKLDFDQFEDEYPEIEDQRFYGFKQLTLANNYQDSSLIREKVAADIFREAGVAAPETAFYAVYVDYGEGPIYFGLYTMVEVIEDTVIETQFEEDGGNVYKPDGIGASFAANSFSEESFDKETNVEEADWSDILSLYDALYSETRTTNPEQWRTELEAVFDVDKFINWLAVNVVIQNWDTYGGMTHNYYLYNDPTTNQLTWIPWDNNESLRSKSGKSQVLSLSLDEVNENWPLIRYLMDDEVYHAQYVADVEAVINGAFEPDSITQRYEELYSLIQPYVTGDQGEIEGHTFLNSSAEFENAFTELKFHAYQRYEDAWNYVQSQ